ncbi:MAG TPA: hypothetical protein VGC87_02300 [Pyrinomonadaceae bacterium]
MLRRFAVVLAIVTLAPIVIAQSENKTAQICVGSNVPYGYVVIGLATRPERAGGRPCARRSACDLDLEESARRSYNTLPGRQKFPPGMILLPRDSRVTQ